jgi:type IX secretion system PorP/SprF family membrane protein
LYRPQILMHFKRPICSFLNYSRAYLFAFILTLICGLSRAQDIPRLPIQFGLFFNAYSMINPASSGAKNTIEIQAGRQQNSGVRRGVATSYLSGAFRIHNVKTSNFSVMGLSFLSDREGEYLKRSGAYFIYAWHTRLTEKISISAGVNGGIYSYNVSGTNANAAGSATAIDGAAGLWLYAKQFYTGISINQIPNSQLTPVYEETTRLVRHCNITGGYVLNVHRNVTVIPSMLVRVSSAFPVDLDVAVMVSLKQIFALGVNYRHHKSLVCVVGFEKIKLGNGALNAMFSYAVPVGKIAQNNQPYELTLNYAHQRKSKKKTKK